MPADMVRDFMRVVQQPEPQRPIAELHHLERELRDQFGGKRNYILKNATAEREGQAERQACAAGVTVRGVAVFVWVRSRAALHDRRPFGARRTQTFVARPVHYKTAAQARGFLTLLFFVVLDLVDAVTCRPAGRLGAVPVDRSRVRFREVSQRPATIRRTVG
jgi:hypothetical protein